MSPNENTSNFLPIASLVAFALAASTLMGACVWLYFYATTEFDGLLLVPVFVLTVPVIVVSVVVSAFAAVRRRWVMIPLLFVQVPTLLILTYVYCNS